MRITVDLPPAVHRQARKLAAQRGASLSSVVADLAARGLSQLDHPAATDERTGLPVLSVGRPVTSREVDEALNEA